MTIQEKIACTDNASITEIHLWKEGVFWVAYEQSAYLVWLLKNYKVTKKFVKSAGMDVVSVGFPDNALAGLVETRHATSLRTNAQTDTHIIIPTGTAFDKEEFLAWKNAISLKTGCDTSRRDAMHCVSTTARTEPTHADIIAQIKSFDLSNATPMMCMLFLSEIKKQLTN